MDIFPKKELAGHSFNFAAHFVYKIIVEVIM